MTRQNTQSRLAKIATALAAYFLYASGAIAQISSDGPLPFDAIPADAASPFGGMSISPTRLVMEAGRRGQGVTLYNSSDKTVTYRIEMIDLNVSETGEVSELEDGESAHWSAARYLRYAPRQVTLGGGERQTVKFISRAPRDTAPGEYRSHVRFSSIPTLAPVGDDKAHKKAADPNAISVSVGLDFRVTIPVLLRVGDLSGGVEIKTAKSVIRNGKKSVELSLGRMGDMSAYGTLKVFDASENEIGLLRGVSILPPNTSRTVHVPIKDLSAEPVSVKYFEQVAGRKTGALLAQASISR